jgi:hypothetical protein
VLGDSDFAAHAARKITGQHFFTPILQSLAMNSNEAPKVIGNGRPRANGCDLIADRSIKSLGEIYTVSHAIQGVVEWIQENNN